MTDAIVLLTSFAGVVLALVAVILVLSTRAQMRPVAEAAESSDPTLTAPRSEARAAVDAPSLPRQAGRTGNADDVPGVQTNPGDSLVDPATGLKTPRAWNAVLEQEDSRFLRYGHPATVVVIDLDGLDALAGVLGQNAADRLIVPVAATLRLNARAADVLARTGYSRFLALLPETDEIAAISYIDRVRTACDTWLEAGEVSVRLAIGWAQATSGAHLADAMNVAEKRMHSDRRHSRAATGEPAQSEAAAGAVETPS